jgi:ABC-type multidrug transport system ATPase subunit
MPPSRSLPRTRRCAGPSMCCSRLASAICDLASPATELSGGEAQRIKLATELQRTQRGDTLYVLDEPTTGLHPADVERLIAQLNGLVESGNTVIVVEHDMRVAAGSDWVMDIGPGAGDEGGHVVAFGTPVEVAGSSISRTAPYLSPSRLSLAKRSLRKEGCGADSLGVRKHVVVDRNQPVRALGVARLLR